MPQPLNHLHLSLVPFCIITPNHSTTCTCHYFHSVLLCHNHSTTFTGHYLHSVLLRYNHPSIARVISSILYYYATTILPLALVIISPLYYYAATTLPLPLSLFPFHATTTQPLALVITVVPFCIITPNHSTTYGYTCHYFHSVLLGHIYSSLYNGFAYPSS
jgi:hypothetical protein